ncbi:hypothetical protein [Oryzibacter oryziterrae]|uniref:hypothetical protein n=1 Tax=Oryzibacter oryziterrae TaxID=2766474 RepID=UPI001F257844|nr:hypothetical protein [Oryzibacter oryziterrae]
MIKVVVGMALVLAVSLGGCASGPSDFVKMSKDTNTAPSVKIRNASQQTALAAALSAQRRGGGSVNDATGSEASLMALTVIRQQQNEEAQALLAEGGASVPINKPACDATVVAPAPGACPTVATTTQASAQAVK